MSKRYRKWVYFFSVLWMSWVSVAFAQASVLSLSLKEAIYLAVRKNPNVQIMRLNETAEKFNLAVQQWAFSPHYSLGATANLISGNMPGQQNFNIQPGVSLQTSTGALISLDLSNVESNHYNPGLSLNIMQPLIRGFGKAIVETALNNAKDTEIISRLNVEASLKNVVSAVIDAYLDIISAERTIIIDEDALKRAENSVSQTKLFIKAGDKAQNELVTVEANVASAKSQLENDRNHLHEAQYALLTVIGLDPNTPIYFSSIQLNELIKRYHLPSLQETQQLVLANDIQYQIDQITLYGPTTRSLLEAEDNTHWQLNLTANVATGNGSGGGQNAGINSLINGVNQSQSVGLTLQVPIDDQIAKQAVENAKIALKQAEIALREEKWSKETSSINAWNLVVSAKRSLQFANDAENLQRKTYQVSYQKYLHGLIDSLELQTAELQLVEAEQTWLNANINYIKALVNLDLLTGHTLKTWDIQVRL